MPIPTHDHCAPQPAEGVWEAIEIRAARELPDPDGIVRGGGPGTKPLNHQQWILAWTYWNRTAPNIGWGRPEPARHPNMVTARARRALTQAAHDLTTGGHLCDGTDPRWVAGRLRAVADSIESDHDALMNRPRPALGYRHRGELALRERTAA